MSRATVRIESGPVRHFLSVRFDPVDEAIVAVPFADFPLEAGVVYRLVVDGVRDLDDRPLLEPVTVTFRTAVELGEPARLPEAGWDDVRGLFERSCSGEGCHGPGPAALGLDLSSGRGVRETALGIQSAQFPGGTSGVEGARGAFVLSGLPIVDRVGGDGRPSGSYLMYKVLGDSHILGEPMPPSREDGSLQPLSRAELDTIAAWILSGAPTD